MSERTLGSPFLRWCAIVAKVAAVVLICQAYKVGVMQEEPANLTVLLACGCTYFLFRNKERSDG